jgi:glycosyltransferase involved in cell wall biosynthesis
LTHTTIFSALYKPHTGGIETFTDKLAAALAARGDGVRIVTSRLPGTSGRETLSNGVEVVRLPAHVLLGGRLPIPKRSRAYHAAFEELLGEPTDRVLVNTRFYGHSLEGLRLAAGKGVPALVLDHGSAHLTLGNPAADALVERYEHAATEKVKAYAPAFAGISEKSRAWLGHFGIGTDLVVPNAIDAQEFRSASSGRDFRRELGIGDGPLVSFVGRLTPEKGPDKLLAAARTDPEKSYVLAGDGPLAASLSAGKPDNVHLVGNLDRSDLSALLGQSDAFCLPTRSEGFCTSLLEAGAWGVPAVVPDVGGAREVVGDDEYGVVVSDVEASTLVAALDRVFDPGTRMGGKGLVRRVENEYGWDSTVRALDRAFEAAAAR